MTAAGGENSSKAAVSRSLVGYSCGFCFGLPAADPAGAIAVLSCEYMAALGRPGSASTPPSPAEPGMGGMMPLISVGAKWSVVNVSSARSEHVWRNVEQQTQRPASDGSSAAVTVTSGSGSRLLAMVLGAAI